MVDGWIYVMDQTLHYLYLKRYRYKFLYVISTPRFYGNVVSYFICNLITAENSTKSYRLIYFYYLLTVENRTRSCVVCEMSDDVNQLFYLT